MSRGLVAVVAAFFVAILLAACTQSPPEYKELPASPFEGGEISDLSGYKTLADYTGEVRLVNTDVRAVDELIREGGTFILFAGFDDCPYCNRVLPHLNETAIAADTYVGYLDTRKDPSWKSNMDIDDYDLFVEHFGDWIDKDDDGTPHLFVPQVFYVKDGEVVATHTGVVEGADDPEAELTEEQVARLMKELSNEFNMLA